MTAEFSYTTAFDALEQFNLQPETSLEVPTPSIENWIEAMKRQLGRDLSKPAPELPVPPRWKLLIGVLRPVIDDYVSNALKSATVEQLEDGTYYTEVAELQGVWADSDSEQNAREELADVIREWLELKIEDEDYDIPVIDHLDLNATVRNVLSQTVRP